uniref:Uncharacterized protein n=1 Tax=Meloidogyne javanica TaxID=6303 RepID=A0A915LWF4_MELJA
MLFASTFRRGGENTNLNSSSSNNYNNNDNHQEYRRRSLLVRRHTCSVLDPSKISTGAALLAPLGCQFVGRVHLLDATSTELLLNKNNKSLTSTPRGSLCIPLISSSTTPRSTSATALLRRSLTHRRRSQPKFTAIYGVAQHVATTTLMPALLVN